MQIKVPIDVKMDMDTIIARLKEDGFVPVVRCKECKHSLEDKMFGGLWCQHPTEKHCERSADFYCGNGERSENGEIHIR